LKGYAQIYLFVHTYNTCAHTMSHLEGMNYFELCEEYNKIRDPLVCRLKNKLYNDNEKEINRLIHNCFKPHEKSVSLYDLIEMSIVVLSMIYFYVLMQYLPFGAVSMLSIVIWIFGCILHHMHNDHLNGIVKFYILQTRKITKEMIEEVEEEIKDERNGMIKKLNKRREKYGWYEVKDYNQMIRDVNNMTVSDKQKLINALFTDK